MNLATATVDRIVLPCRPVRQSREVHTDLLTQQRVLRDPCEEMVIVRTVPLDLVEEVDFSGIISHTIVSIGHRRILCTRIVLAEWGVAIMLEQFVPLTRRRPM